MKRFAGKPCRIALRLSCSRFAAAAPEEAGVWGRAPEEAAASDSPQRCVTHRVASDFGSSHSGPSQMCLGRRLIGCGFRHSDVLPLHGGKDNNSFARCAGPKLEA